MQYELVHYGFLSDIFRAKPALSLSDNNKITLLKGDSSESSLDLNFTKTNTIEDINISYPQETPCVNYLSADKFTDTEITFDTIRDIIANIGDYANNTQFNLRITRGMESHIYLISNTTTTNVTLSDGDIIDIKALGTASRYDSAWSPPILFGSTRPIITIKLDGTVFVNTIDSDYVYKYKIDSGSETFYTNSV